MEEKENINNVNVEKKEESIEVLDEKVTTTPAENTNQVVNNVSVEPTPQPQKKESIFSKIKKVLTTDIGGGGKTDKNGKVKELSPSKLKKLEQEKQKLLMELSDPNLPKYDHTVIFVYKARKPNGEIINGRLYGFSKSEINSYLLNEGYDPISIENNKWIEFTNRDSMFGSGRMKGKDLIFFLTQVATYVKAGITLADSMKILLEQAKKDKKKRGIYESIVYELTMGTAFSDAIAKQGNTFPPLLINMLKAAEATGELEETLDDMVAYYSDVETTRKEMINALTYPAIVTVFAFGVITFIMLYVVPQFSEIYVSMEIEVSGLTLFLLNLSNFLKDYILLILLVILLIIVLFVVLYKNVVKYRAFFQRIFMKLPVIGNIIIYKEMVIFSKTFSSLLKNNVNITESVEILSKITSNEIYKGIMKKTIDNISVGEKISEAFKDQWAVPDVAYHMIVTGEETGQLAEMMAKVADFYQEQHHTIVSSLKSLIEPILIAFLAVIVGVILIAVIVPMFNMYEQLSLG